MSEWHSIFETPNIPEQFYKTLPKHAFGNSIIKLNKDNISSISEAHIVIIGVPEDRNAVNNLGSSKAPDFIREQFYQLMNKTPQIKIADLGNMIQGGKPYDTYIALSLVISELLIKKQFPIILGGSNDLVFANYLAYEKNEQIINITSIDSSFDIGEPESSLNSHSYVNQIVMRQPNYLFNYTNMGYQSYFVDNDMTILMNKLFFDFYRVGMLRQNLEETEPLLRNADLLNIDISSVRFSDAPANENASPNGFYGEEICQICRYAGMSDKLSSAGFYEINPLLDNNHQTAKLTAQMIWFLIEGFSLRKNDNPRTSADDFYKYHVFNKKLDTEILFHKSKKTGRWWMEVPFPIDKSEKHLRHYLIACSYKDYQTAINDELPDRWWQTYQKIM
jgi:formiminoglutamase